LLVVGSMSTGQSVTCGYGTSLPCRLTPWHGRSGWEACRWCRCWPADHTPTVRNSYLA